MSKLRWLVTSGLVLMFCAAAVRSGHAQAFSTLVSFNIADGAFPSAALVQGRDGNLYGTTDRGGITSCQPTYGCGTVFKVSRTGTVMTLYKFCSLTNCADGTNPLGALVLGTDGNFYGTTSSGGAYNGGTIFKITPRGVLTTLYSFCAQTNCADGQSPRSGLTLGADGNLYGVTYFGGASTSFDGTVFKITTNGQFTTLHSFDGIDDGYFPTSLIQGSDGNFYGATYGGIALGGCQSTGCGTVFKITPSGALTTLHIFNFADGSNPSGQLVESTKGNFSGTTQYGGTVLDVCDVGCGTIFKVTATGKFATLHDFNWSDGSRPFAGLTLATDGNYYGTTSTGAPEGNGNIYEVGTGRGITSVYNFEDSDFSEAALLQASSGIFYGTTAGDGDTSNGTLFSEDVGLGPFIAFVQPTGKVGKAAQILGQGLTGTTSVTFNGVPATSFTVLADTYMTAVVPTGATTGPVVVTTPAGPLTSNVSFRITR